MSLNIKEYEKTKYFPLISNSKFALDRGENRCTKKNRDLNISELDSLSIYLN